MGVLIRKYVKYTIRALQQSQPFKEFLSAFYESLFKANLHHLKFEDKAFLQFCIQHEILTVAECGARNAERHFNSKMWSMLCIVGCRRRSTGRGRAG